MNPEDRRLAIARITGGLDRNGYLPVTIGGDGLNSVKTPLDAELYCPEYSGNDLSQILKVSRFGPDEKGKFIPVTLEKVKISGSRARIQLLQPIPDDLQGYWLCVRSSQLQKNQNEFFVYEIMGLPVFKEISGDRIGTVIEYQQTGAHGIIEIELSDKKLIMVPMLSRFVEFTKNKSGLLIESLDDFILD